MQLFDAASLSDRALEQILSFLRSGGVIAFPTDTAYGLGADPFNEGAVRRIFEMKGDQTNPCARRFNSHGQQHRQTLRYRACSRGKILARPLDDGPPSTSFGLRYGNSGI